MGLIHVCICIFLLLLLLLSCFSRVQLCATPEMAAHQAPPPWDSPGKNAGVACHFLLQCMKGKSESDCGSDHELLIAKFRLKLKKVRETTRPFRYDLNQIPYDYTMEVRNRFKGLDLID